MGGPGTSAASTTSTRPEVTIRGVVATTSASARVITIAPAVQGITDIAVAGDTEIRRADGRSATLADIPSGATIEVTGRPTNPTSLLARRVVIVS